VVPSWLLHDFFPPVTLSPRPKSTYTRVLNTGATSGYACSSIDQSEASLRRWQGLLRLLKLGGNSSGHLYLDRHDKP
jgi:hypothetical protein